MGKCMKLLFSKCDSLTFTGDLRPKEQLMLKRINFYHKAKRPKPKTPKVSMKAVISLLYMFICWEDVTMRLVLIIQNYVKNDQNTSKFHRRFFLHKINKIMKETRLKFWHRAHLKKNMQICYFIIKISNEYIYGKFYKIAPFEQHKCRKI